MDFVDRSLAFRSRIRDFIVGWVNPSKLADETRRSKLTTTIQNHWQIKDADVYELIRETWDDCTAPTGSEEAPAEFQFAVFIDSELDIDWCTKGDLADEISQAVTHAEAIGAKRCKHLPTDQILEFKRMIGHAIVAAIRGGVQDARKLQEEAATYLRERTAERSRQWTLISAHIVFVSLFVIFLLIPPAFGSDPRTAEITGLWLGTAGGLLGAYLSIIQKAGRGEWDAAAGFALHCLEVFTKLAAGCLLGALAFAITRSARAPAPIASITPDQYSMFLFGFAAGFFERLIPKIISSYPHKSHPNDSL